MTLQSLPSSAHPSHDRALGSDCRTVWGWRMSGADVGCGVIPNPEDILGFAGRELSLPPAGHGMRMCLCRSSRAQGCSVCWVCAGCFPAPSATTWRCASAQWPPGCPLVIHPMLPPSRPHRSVPVCRPRGWRDSMAPSEDRQQVRDAPKVISFLHGFLGAVSLLPWQLDCGTEGGTPVTLPSLPALPPAACPQPSRGHIPFSVPNKPRLVTAGDLCFVLVGAECREGCEPGAAPVGTRVWG